MIFAADSYRVRYAKFEESYKYDKDVGANASPANYYGKFQKRGAATYFRIFSLQCARVLTSEVVGCFVSSVASSEKRVQ